MRGATSLGYGLVLMCGLVFNSCTYIDVHKSIHKKGIQFTYPKTRPQRCAKYKRKYNESEWNEDTQTYPPNHEWMKCMGVEMK